MEFLLEVGVTVADLFGMSTDPGLGVTQVQWHTTPGLWLPRSDHWSERRQEEVVK